VLLPKLLNSITLNLKSLHWLKTNERIKCKVLCLTFKSLKTGQPSYIRSPNLSFPSHCFTRSTLINLSRPFITSRIKIANNLSIIALLFCETVSYLTYVTLLITSLIHLYYTRLSLIFQPLFLKSLKKLSLSLFFSSLVFI